MSLPPSATCSGCAFLGPVFPQPRQRFGTPQPRAVGRSRCCEGSACHPSCSARTLPQAAAAIAAAALRTGTSRWLREPPRGHGLCHPPTLHLLAQEGARAPDQALLPWAEQDPVRPRSVRWQSGARRRDELCGCREDLLLQRWLQPSSAKVPGWRGRGGRRARLYAGWKVFLGEEGSPGMPGQPEESCGEGAGFSPLNSCLHKAGLVPVSQAGSPGGEQAVRESASRVPGGCYRCPQPRQAALGRVSWGAQPMWTPQGPGAGSTVVLTGVT